MDNEARDCNTVLVEKGVGIFRAGRKWVGILNHKLTKKKNLNRSGHDMDCHERSAYAS